MGSDVLADNSTAVLRRAVQIPPEQRYDRLKAWVLPGPEHPDFRLNGHFSPLSPAPLVAQYTREERERLRVAEAEGRGRVLVGGSLLAPALELVATAKELGQLEALRAEIEAARPAATVDPFDHSQRAALALLILVDIAQGQYPAAADQLQTLGRTVIHHPIRDHRERWPEMVAFWQSVRHPVTCEAVTETLFEFVYRDLHGGKGTGSDLWDRQLLGLMGFQRIMQSPTGTEGDYYRALPTNQWTPAGFEWASTRGQGMPGARWIHSDQGIAQLSGHENDFLYFQSPLQGNFEVDCLTTTFDWRECEMFFKGRWLGPAWGMTHIETGDHRRNYSKPQLSRKMDTEVGKWFHVTIRDRDGLGQFIVNGREIPLESLNLAKDPWMGARFWHRYHGGIRDVRISGTPVIPESIKLIYDSDLTGWSSYYETQNFQRFRHWRSNSQELESQLGPNPQLSPLIAPDPRMHAGDESLLRYHRPILEDGVIEYEFLYRRNQYHVHPVLDRLAFVLDPDMVRLHWCTDGVYEQTELSAENLFEEPEHQLLQGPLPLREGKWNRVRLELKGNSVTVSLNDTPVFRRPIEATNMRRFGLFHFPYRSVVRVRDMVWTGQWPKQLPALEDQELADTALLRQLDAEAEKLTPAVPDNAGVITFLDKGLDQLSFREKRHTADGLISAVAAHPAGWLATQESRAPETWIAHSLFAPYQLQGDFDITAEFEGLTATPPQSSRFFNGINLTLRLDSTPKQAIKFHARCNVKEDYFLDTMVDRPRSNGEAEWDSQPAPEEATAGRLRLARRGTMLYFLFARAGSPHFRLLRTTTVSDQGILPEGLELQISMGDPGQTSVVWKSLAVRAAP